MSFNINTGTYLLVSASRYRPSRTRSRGPFKNQWYLKKQYGHSPPLADVSHFLADLRHKDHPGRSMVAGMTTTTTTRGESEVNSAPTTHVHSSGGVASMGVDAARLTRLKFMGKRIRAGYAPRQIRTILEIYATQFPEVRGGPPLPVCLSRARARACPPKAPLHFMLFSIRHNNNGAVAIHVASVNCATCRGYIRRYLRTSFFPFEACHRLYATLIRAARLRQPLRL